MQPAAGGGEVTAAASSLCRAKVARHRLGGTPGTRWGPRSTRRESLVGVYLSGAPAGWQGAGARASPGSTGSPGHKACIGELTQPEPARLGGKAGGPRRWASCWLGCPRSLSSHRRSWEGVRRISEDLHCCEPRRSPLGHPAPSASGSWQSSWCSQGQFGYWERELRLGDPHTGCTGCHPGAPARFMSRDFQRPAITAC